MGRSPSKNREKKETITRECECCGTDMKVRLVGSSCKHFKSYWFCDSPRHDPDVLPVRYRGWRRDSQVTVS
jgi:hypothetical protein